VEECAQRGGCELDGDAATARIAELAAAALRNSRNLAELVAAGRPAAGARTLADRDRRSSPPAPAVELT